ncbi:MAG: hypothetical protein V7K71_23990 [Nostoc sp.]|uniref:hypothetical protein n=1 Tax=Nostoc sp. TaxID=1180 RepID=UPI002FF51F85
MLILSLFPLTLTLYPTYARSLIYKLLNASCFSQGETLREQVGRADDSRLKSGNPPTALSPQRTGSF